MPKYNNEELIELIKNNIDLKQNYEQLYKQNSGFIFQVIRKRVHGIYEIDDLMQQSFIALVKAVEYCDTSRPAEEKNFLQILKYYIWKEIGNLVSCVPAYMQAKIIEYKKTYRRLYDKLGYKPSTLEMMSELNISIKELNKIQAAMQEAISLDEPIGKEGDTTRLDLYASQADERDPFEEFLDREVNKELSAILHEVIDELPKISKEVVYKRVVEDKTLEAVGQEYNVTRERVRQIEKKALRTLGNNKQFMKRVHDYLELYGFKRVGLSEFNRTHTSEVELAVINKEDYTEREKVIMSWLQ